MLGSRTSLAIPNDSNSSPISSVIGPHSRVRVSVSVSFNVRIRIRIRFRVRFTPGWALISVLLGGGDNEG